MNCWIAYSSKLWIFTSFSLYFFQHFREWSSSMSNEIQHFAYFQIVQRFSLFFISYFIMYFLLMSFFAIMYFFDYLLISRYQRTQIEIIFLTCVSFSNVSNIFVQHRLIEKIIKMNLQKYYVFSFKMRSYTNFLFWSSF